ncbi:protein DETOXIFICATION 43-like [Impatiens glandulifera]|uniref:protein DETOXIFICATION 43-like n=1 Tax=Impatiens glandulifera TaxID=253017 RepID=UPI001FB1046D|nr:protein DETOXIFICATION 43-like [Impatiens glandulifera]XP_047319469.1 protein DETOXIFICATION 43-like [Impatiens glandulifera]XP_047319470.1 protein DETOXIFICATION 43-like [Impatiens glandulifera]XP_047319471.1 protein DETOXIFICATION 43-like [Impatiens glandulifera]
MAEEGSVPPPEHRNCTWPILVFFNNARLVFKMDELGVEILQIALPAALALAADPIASLIDTAYIGRLGPVDLAAVGVAIAIFNQVSKVTIFPLVSLTTSFVAEEDTMTRLNMKAAIIAEDSDVLPTKTNEQKQLMPVDGEPENTKMVSNKDIEKNEPTTPEEDVELENLEKGVASTVKPTELMLGNSETVEDKQPMVVSSSNKTVKSKSRKEKRHIPSASTALLLGGVLGLLQTIFLIFLAKPILGFMGVKSGSPMLKPAQRYLTLRAFGAPAVLLSLAMQGVFRGFKDTKTPLYATVVGDVMNIILDPIFMFTCRLGVSGAAIAHVLSQYLIALILLCKLVQKVVLLPPSSKNLQFGRFLKNGVMLLARVIAVTFCVTLAASLAARLGTTPMAAFQICLQVWMTSSLLADGLAVAGQAILACAFAEKDYEKATAAASRVLQMGFILGLGLSVVVGLGLQFGSGIFTKDKNVIYFISIGIPFVAATQPINSLAFVFDGVNFGASDFAYSAYSMVAVALVSIGSLFALSKTSGFIGIWLALTIYMGLRTFAGIWRMGTGTGPWRFLRGRTMI